METVKCANRSARCAYRFQLKLSLLEFLLFRECRLYQFLTAFFDSLVLSRDNIASRTAGHANDFGSTTSKWAAFSITTSFISSPFVFAASAYSVAIESGTVLSTSPCTLICFTPSGNRSIGEAWL